jgi:hypothetical protein
MEILFEPVSEFNPAVDLFTRPANHPRPWFVSLDTYNNLAPWFGHDPIPPAPKFPKTDEFLTNYIDKQNSNMTEQSLIEYAKAGDKGAIDYLAANGFEGVDWTYAITHVNGRWLPGNEIVLVWNEMVKLRDGSGGNMAAIQKGLQDALDGHHTRTRKVDPVLAMASPAGRPWHFTQKHSLKWGQRGNKFTPPKKKRKK